jgi:hypothetical protein
MISLDELAADPVRLAALSPDDRSVVILRLATLLAGIAAAPVVVANQAPASDSVIGIKEASVVLGESVDHLYRTALKRGLAWKGDDGRLKFSRGRLARYIAARTAGH